MPKTKQPIATKAPESVVCKMMCKLLGLPEETDIESVCYACSTADRISHLLDIVSEVDGLYPWQVNITADIMNAKSTPLVEDIISTPNTLYVVRDTMRSGVDSLWLAGADLSAARKSMINMLPYRGLIHSFSVGGEISQVIAIQLSSCRP